MQFSASNTKQMQLARRGGGQRTLKSNSPRDIETLKLTSPIALVYLSGRISLNNFRLIYEIEPVN
jgi:hypothetical protein